MFVIVRVVILKQFMNPLLCASVKNKKETGVQCTYKRLPNQVFCGIHGKQKDVILFTPLQETEPAIEVAVAASPNISVHVTVHTGVHIPSDVSTSEQTTVVPTKITEVPAIDGGQGKKREPCEKRVILKRIVEPQENVPLPEFFEALSEEECYKKRHLITQVFKEYNKCPSIWSRKFLEQYVRPFLFIDPKKDNIEWKHLHKMTANQMYQLFQPLVLQYLEYQCAEPFIRKIQQTIRYHWKQRMTTCTNEEDFTSMEPLTNIPSLYFVRMRQEGKWYGFDIRSLHQWWSHSEKTFETGKKINPFTMIPFTELDLIPYTRKKDYIEQVICRSMLTPEQIKELTRVKTTDEIIFSTFYQIQQLDFYNDGPKWVKALSPLKLIEFYVQLEDIWSYRSQLNSQQKKNMVQSGILFTTPIFAIKKMTDMDKLKRVIFSECYRLVHEGVTRDDRKLGAMFVLIGLTMVSKDAHDALPHLVM
jgi:hypothetical protein